MPLFLNRYIGILCLLLIFVSCQSSKLIAEFEQDEKGVYHAQKNTLPKGAIRLTIQIKSSETNDGKTTYLAEVLQIHQNGGGVGTVKPKRGEEVLISAKKDFGFKGGDQVKIDALPPLQKEGELLHIVML